MTDCCHPGLRGMVQNVLSDKLLLETDAPYLWGPHHLGYNPVRAPLLIYHITKESAGGGVPPWGDPPPDKKNH